MFQSLGLRFRVKVKANEFGGIIRRQFKQEEQDYALTNPLERLWRGKDVNRKQRKPQGIV